MSGSLGTSPVDLNQILANLRDILSGIATFRTVSRRLKLWSQVDAGKQPALFVYSPKHDVMPRKTGMPSMTVVHGEVMIYCRTDAEKDTGPSQVDAFYELVKTALAPSPTTGTCTLGLPVVDIRIEGEVITEHGDLDGQGVLYVPLKIILP